MRATLTTELACVLAAGLVVVLWREAFVGPANVSLRPARDPGRRSFAFVTRPDFLFTFGDSYTSENWPWYQQQNPLDPYEPHAASDGPVWARNLSRSYDPPATLVNLACGGATIDNGVVHHPAPPLDFTHQVSSFLAHLTPAPSAVPWHPYNSLFALEFGTNDIIVAMYPTDRMRRLNQTEAELHKELMWRYFDSVERLYDAGARAFAFHLLVPFDRARLGIDLGPLLQAQLKQSIQRFNAALQKAADAYCEYKHLQTGGDIFCSVIDLYTLGHDIMNQPEHYGFKEAIEFCPGYSWRSNAEPDYDVDPSCVGPVGDYVWKDHLHPTWTFHQWWARQFHRQMVQEAPNDPIDVTEL